MICKECWKEKKDKEMKSDRCCKKCWKPYMKDLEFGVQVNPDEYFLC